MKLTKKQLDIIEGISQGKLYKYKLHVNGSWSIPTEYITIPLLLNDSAIIEECAKEIPLKDTVMKYPYPLMVEPINDSYVYIVDTLSAEGVKRVKYDSSKHKEFLNKGLMHLDKDNAVMHYGAIAGLY